MIFSPIEDKAIEEELLLNAKRSIPEAAKRRMIGAEVPYLTLSEAATAQELIAHDIQLDVDSRQCSDFEVVYRNITVLLNNITPGQFETLPATIKYGWISTINTARSLLPTYQESGERLVHLSAEEALYLGEVAAPVGNLHDMIDKGELNHRSSEVLRLLPDLSRYFARTVEFAERNEWKNISQLRRYFSEKIYASTLVI